MVSNFVLLTGKLASVLKTSKKPLIYDDSLSSVILFSPYFLLQSVIYSDKELLV